jgi:hypothetical protein
MEGHVIHTGVKRNTYILLVEEPERKKPLGKPRSVLGGKY